MSCRAKALGLGGFTMTEVMVVMAILGILALFGSGLMNQVQNYSMMNRARIATQQENRNIMNIFTKEIHEARATSIAIGARAGQPPGSMISFTKAGDDLNDPQDDIAVEFYQQGTELYHVHSGTQAVLTDNLRFVAFMFPRTDVRALVSVSLGLEKATYQGKKRALQMAQESIMVMN